MQVVYVGGDKRRRNEGTGRVKQRRRKVRVRMYG